MIIKILSMLLIYYYTGAELKELVAVLGTCSESLLRDFAALHTTVVQHYHILHGELLKPITTTSTTTTSTNTAAGTAEVSNSSTASTPPRTSLSPQPSPSLTNTSPLQHLHNNNTTPNISTTTATSSNIPTQAIIPTQTLSELLEQSDLMLNKLITQDHNTIIKLKNQLNEEINNKKQFEATILDLQTRIEYLNKQLLMEENNKYSIDQRCNTEVRMSLYDFVRVLYGFIVLYIGFILCYSTIIWVYMCIVSIFYTTQY